MVLLIFFFNVLKVNAQYFVSVLVSSVELPSDFALNLTWVCTKNRFGPDVHFPINLSFCKIFWVVN